MYSQANPEYLISAEVFCIEFWIHACMVFVCMALQVAKSSRAELDTQVQKLKAQHDDDISNIISKLEKDKEDSLTSIKTSFTADKQVRNKSAPVASR